MAEDSTVLENFPEDYNYEVLSWKEEAIGADDGVGYVSEVMVSGVTDREGAKEWLNQYERLSGTQWRIRTTYSSNLSMSQVFKIGYRCHHNTRGAKGKSDKPVNKNTNCNASMMVTVLKSDAKSYFDLTIGDHLHEFLLYSSYFDLTIGDHLHEFWGLCRGTEFLMRVYLKSTHNHTISTADALRHRRPTDDVRDKFHSLFKGGHSASSALMTHKFDLQEKYGDDYFKYAADGAHCPSLKWCYYQYNSVFKKKYGSTDGEPMIDSLREAVSRYNTTCGVKCADLIYDKGDKPSSSDLVVAFCSPFMQRVHEKLKSSSEICFVDASGTMDRHNTRIFIFMTASAAGALPLGIVMTYSESEAALKKGFKLLKSLYPPNSFHGVGFPKIFMTDDCVTLRRVLHELFNESVLLLCIFHVLQAFWRWLWDSTHKIEKNDRSYIYLLFKTLIRSESATDFDKKFDLLKNDEVVLKYKDLLKYINGLVERSQEWALFHRSDILTRGHHTNNYAEATFRVMKDKVFLRLKAYNVVQTFDFLITRFHSYLEQRIVDCISNRSVKRSGHYSIPVSKTINLTCAQLSADEFEVKNLEKGTQYVVNIYLEICTCKVGQCGAPCKHQYAVFLKFKISSDQFLPHTDNVAKDRLHFIVYGSEAPQEWYKGLKGESVEERGSESEGTVQNFSEKDTESAFTSADNLDETNDSDKTAETFYTPEIIANTDHDLLELMEQLRASMANKPDVFVPAVQKFISNFKKQNSESSLVSALHMFGNSSSTVSKVSNHSTIPVGPTAVGRRTAYLGGRTIQCQGRPAKDHKRTDALKRGADPTWAKPPAKREAHNLSQCVAEGKSLGKSHSKK